MEQIKVTIKPDGTFEYEVKGVKGKSCKDLTKAIDDLGVVAESKKTDEYNQTPNACQLKNYNS